ncbi:hypothetical protein BH09VER1_BH09VER1_51230 [soil metagenome]
MLSYIGLGTRQYGNKPLASLQRPYWEFQAVLQGAIGLLRPDGPDVLRERRLWVFPPGHAHGWTGERGRAAEVAVFHFAAVPEPVRHLAEREEHLEIPLEAADGQRLRKLARAADRYWQQPGPAMFLCHEHILLELSLLVCERSAAPAEASKSSSQQRVTAAIRYFTAHMEENPSLETVALKVGASAVHLRRLFHEVLQAAPKQVFDQLRFQRAIQLMTGPDLKLESIGEACGFQSASAFSRAFKIKFGCSPQVWRG